MNKSFAAPPRIRRIAARRVFKAPSGKPVVVTLGVPQAVDPLIRQLTLYRDLVDQKTGGSQ